MEAYSSMAKNPGYTEETLNLSMTAKQPPSCDGKVSWFRYEELVDDWVTITTVEAPKRGPLLKSRLTGDAYMYKAVLQNDLLQDPDEGVNYFKNAEEALFERCDQRVSAQAPQFLQSSKAEPRVPHFYIKIRNPSYEIARHQQAAGVRAPPPALLNEDDPVVLRQYIQGMQDRQRDAFPFGDNLIAHFFIIQSELSDQQRERLTSAMSLRNISLEC